MMQLDKPATLEIGCNGHRQTRRFVPGDIHIIPHGSKLSISSNGVSHAIVISFDDRLLQQTRADGKALGGASLVLKIGIRDLQLQCLLSAVEEELKSGCKTGSGYLQQLSTVLTRYLLERYSTLTEASPPTSDGLPANRLRAVLDHIHTHLEGNLTLEELAQVVHMSPQHFANLFRRSTGLAPHQYVLLQRVERAKDLLANTELPITEITLDVGFANQSHFTDVFHRLAGTTPRRFREFFSSVYSADRLPA